MKILLVCAAGLSTSILMKKLEKYAEQNGIELDIDAVGIGEYQETCANYDVLLLGPQVSYQLNTVKQGSGKPTAVIPAQDYDQLYKDGAAAIFGPGTPIATAAIKILEILLAD